MHEYNWNTINLQVQCWSILISHGRSLCLLPKLFRNCVADFCYWGCYSERERMLIQLLPMRLSARPKIDHSLPWCLCCCIVIWQRQGGNCQFSTLWTKRLEICCHHGLFTFKFWFNSVSEWNSHMFFSLGFAICFYFCGLFCFSIMIPAFCISCWFYNICDVYRKLSLSLRVKAV